MKNWTLLICIVIISVAPAHAQFDGTGLIVGRNFSNQNFNSARL